jgi:O-methyltransferase involved in polyketide biosynthesis
VQIIVRGDATQLQSWREQLLPRLKPGQSAYFIARDALDLPAEIAEKIATDKVTAWVCEGFSCRAPLFELEPLLLLVDE